jgi:hypothetical protein
MQIIYELRVIRYETDNSRNRIQDRRGPEIGGCRPMVDK